MPLDPLLEPMLASLPELPSFPADLADWPAFRKTNRESMEAVIAHVMEPGPEVGDVQRVNVAVGGGEIVLVVYTPSTVGPHPVHLYLHGGGWVEGSVHDTAVDTFCRERAALAGCLVVSVGYRKAPEHPFPTALDDCFAALQWVAGHAEQLNAAADRITVGGGSAGANLAAALTLKSRDERGPAISFALLEVPALDFTMSHASHELYATGYGLTRRTVEFCRAAYLGSDGDVVNPYASPLHAADLSGLPPTHIMAAEYDVLRDEAAAYAARLKQAGVPVTYSMQPGQVHVSSGLTKVLPAARAWRDEVLDVLRAHAHA